MLDLLGDKENPAAEEIRAVEVGGVTTVGRIVDALGTNEDVAQLRDRGISFHTTVGRLLDLAGKDRVRDYIQQKAMEASFTEEYSNTRENILSNWMTLVSFALLYALLATVTLEFIDHDKR